uniref:Uncharacterized protein n=1 Tax=Timema tahoe TaxID=61484 RepID=A0A7R9FH22_9NEOP|nr:unnamed protein product [Timema tahoe]
MEKRSALEEIEMVWSCNEDVGVHEIVEEARLSECLACNEHLLRPDLVDMAAKKYFVCVQGAVRQRRSLQNTVRDLVQPQLRILLTPMLRVAMLARRLDAEGGDASSSRIATILNGVLLTQFTWADARSYSVIDQDRLCF